MGAFGGLTLTNRGKILQSKAQTGVQLKYTRIALGDGDLGASTILNLNALIHEVKSLSLSKLKVLGDGSGTAVVGAVLSNQNLTTGFYYRELGVFAVDPDVGEILYCYGNAGALAEYIPAGGTDIIEKIIDVQMIVGNATDVIATIDASLVYETQDGAQQRVDNHEAKKNNPHGVTADQVGSYSKAEADGRYEIPTGSQQKVDNHNLITAGIHGATSSATPNRLVSRDSSGRAKVAAPAADDDIALLSTVKTLLANLVNSSPVTLDTLNELAAALGNDPNFATTMTNALAAKETPAGAQAKADAVTNWVKSFGLGDIAKDISNSDLNTLDATGFYRGAVLFNSPGGNNWYYVINIKNSPVFKIQKAISFYNPSKEYTRVNNNGVWSEWVLVLTDAPNIWSNLILQNGATGANSRPPRYMKKGTNVVIEGEITQGVAAGTIVGTLPVGFRPLVDRMFKTAINSLTSNDGCTFWIRSTGEVTLQAVANATSTIHLSGISFYTD